MFISTQPSFVWWMLERAADSAIASMSTSGLALLSGLAYGLYRLALTYRREGRQGVKEHFAKDALHGLIFGICWWGILFSYHLFIKVPSEIRAQADSVKVPQFYAPSVPAFWITKSLQVAPHQSQELVNVIFKDSSIFTQQRQAHIKAIIDSFCRYLAVSGLALPRDIPPIGVRPGKVIAWSGIFPGSVYDAQLELPREKIDDPQTIRSLYSQWVFQGVVFQGSPDFVEFSLVYHCYFLSSYINKQLCDSDTPSGKWVRALWEIREQQGKDYTDRALIFALKGWEKFPAKDSDALFTSNLLRGFRVRDNDFKHTFAAESVLKKHSLMQ